LVDVTSDLQITNPQLNITLDRDRIAALGLTVDQVESALSTAYGPRQVSTIYAPNNEYQVIIQVAPQFQSDPNAVSMLYVGRPDGGVVPLAELASIEQGVGPLQVNHTGQLPSVTLSFNLKPGVSLGDAVSEVQEAARRSLPATVNGSFQGAAQAFQDSLRGPGMDSAARDLRHLYRARHPV
jgi:HAE1 family hydrophobic/amphiphilic exporter-1